MAIRDQALLVGGQLMNAVRVSWLFLKVGVMNELQYRVNFVVQLLQSAITLVAALAVLALVYSQTDELNGWSQSEILCLTGIQILMLGVIRMFVEPNMSRVIDEVREGTLDYALTKPEDAQVLASVREIRIWQIVDVFSGLIVLGFGLSRITTEVGPIDALAFGAAFLLGGVMIYCFWLVIATGAFWVVNMWHVAELFDGLFNTGRWPVGIYPGWLRITVTFLVPVAFAVTVPAEAVTSRLEWETLLLSFVFAVALFVATRWFWHFGLKRYSGASA
jgi:ABC-2 type transport system permease protein